MKTNFIVFSMYAAGAMSMQLNQMPQSEPLDTIEYIPNSFAQENFGYEDLNDFSADFLAQDEVSALPFDAETSALAQVGASDIYETLFKGINIALDSIYGMGCKFTGCLEPEPMYLAKMWHLMKAHRKRTKITKIIPTWPSPQLAPPSPAPVAGPAAAEGVASFVDTDEDAPATGTPAVVPVPSVAPVKAELSPIAPLALPTKLSFEEQKQFA